MKPKTFTRYETLIIVVLTLLQFTIILDFMVLSPLGAILMPALDLSPSQFGLVVSVYAFSAGISGLLAAGFADRFDRKKMLLVFYAGFILGTFLCGIAASYEMLLLARVVTGIFGGVIGSIGFAIVTDVFPLEVRGRVMGFMQMAVAGSQVLGLPIGIYLATHWDWHLPFLLIVGLCLILGAVIVIYMKPIDSHLRVGKSVGAFRHLTNTVSKRDYVRAFLATMLLATGGFMLMPFASAYTVNNLGIDIGLLWILYTVTGVVSMALGPVIGRLTDTMGIFKVFFAGTILTIMIVMIYCNLGVTPLWGVMLISVFMFTGVSSRMISSQALLSAVPVPQDRGAFMSVNSSMQQISGGVATIIAGLIIVERPNGYLENYPQLGLLISGIMLVTLFLIYRLHGFVIRKPSSGHDVGAKAA